MAHFSIRPITRADRDWVKRFTEEHWGSDLMVIRGERIYISEMEGFAAEAEGEAAGLITYRFQEPACEITSLDSLREGLGIGSALIHAVISTARARGCARLHLTTTNDNINALRFYQKRGFTFAELRKHAVTQSRKIKPEIPLVGDYGIPIRDEIELEMDLTQPL